MAPPLPVIWSPRAERDAARFARRLREAGNHLGDFAEAGRAQGSGRVLVTVPPHLIRYRVRPAGVVILRIKHGAQRP